jgi:tetratricopeptide (TPR) repeat protein
MRLQLRILSCLVSIPLFSLSLFSAAQTKPKVPASSTRPRPSGAFDDLAKRADEAWRASQFEEATKLYGQTVKIRPTWSIGWTRLSGSFYQLNRYAEARDAAREVTILTPKDGPSWAYLGLCEYELRDYRNSFDDLSKGEQLGLGENRDLTAQVKYHLAILWNTAGRFENGLAEIVWFPQQNLGSPEIIQAIGLSVLRMPLFPYEVPDDKQEMILLAGKASFAANAQNMDAAGKVYEELVTKYPSEPNVHYAYGQFLSHLDLVAALKEYEKEVEIDPRQALARIEAAYLYLKMGELEKALTYSQEAIKLLPQNPAGHNLIGRILLELNRPADAIPELVTATRLAPGNSTFHLQLARAYQKSGETALATKEMAAFNDLEKKRAEAQQGKSELPPQ